MKSLKNRRTIKKEEKMTREELDNLFYKVPNGVDYADLLEEVDLEDVPEETINKLISLLSSDDDFLRYKASRLLTNWGLKAGFNVLAQMFVEGKLEDLGFEVVVHDKMPDVVLYNSEKNWLFFIEAVTSVGEISPKRIFEIEEMTKYSNAGNVYVTAFPDFKTYKKFAHNLAWETEVWLSELPEHMIHLNGDRFMGPRK